MNINLDTSRLGASFNPAPETGAAAPAQTQVAPANDKGLSITTAASGLDGLEELDPSVEAALTRDDDLGTFLSGVFNLPPPAMPNFET